MASTIQFRPAQQAQQQQQQQQQAQSQSLPTATTRCESILPKGIYQQEFSSSKPTSSLPALPRVLPPPPTRHRAKLQTFFESSIPLNNQKTTVVRQLKTLPELPAPVPPVDIPAIAFTFPTPLPQQTLPNIFDPTTLTDPLEDLDAFFSQMNAEITDMGVPAWSFDDLFVQDAFADEEEKIVKEPAALTSPVRKASPAPSTESEQSLALDITTDKDFFDFGSFTTEPMAGIMQPAAIDILPPPYTVPQADPVGINDTTMMQTFGTGYGSFGDLQQFGGDANLLGMGSDYLTKLLAQTQPQSTANVDISASLEALLANTDWNASLPVFPTSIAPADLTLPSPPMTSPLIPQTSLKRKDSTSSDETDQPAKRPRGRPPKSRTGSSAIGSPAPGKATPLRVSKAGSIQSTPLVRTVSLEEDDEAATAKRTASGKPSTARPKSVVPEKYFKDGTAQAITGMTMEQILSFPTFDELLKQVSPVKRAGAQEFGERIADNRDKAKDAAKKSRDEKRQKIEQLEGQVEGLEAQVKEMKMFLAGLLGGGRITQVEVAAFM